MVAATFSFFVHAAETDLQGERFKLGRQIRFVTVVQPPVPRFVPALFVPQLEPVALPQQDGLAFEPGELAQFAR